MKGGPSSDEVGLQMFQQMLAHSGKSRLKQLDSPDKEAQEESSEENEVPLEELAQLLAQAKEG